MARKKSMFKVRRKLMHLCPSVCFYCLRPMDLEASTVDHLIPVSKGGSNDLTNLVLCCKQCNGEKADRMPTTEELKMARLWRRDKIKKKKRVRIASDLKRDLANDQYFNTK